MATGLGAFRFGHSIAAVVQQLRLTLGADVQRTLGDTVALLDDRDRQLEDYLTELDKRMTAMSGILPGGIVDWAGAAIPKGYLPCDGAAVDREDYADLYAAI